MAAKRKRYPVATLIAAIREGELELRVQPGEEGYHAFVVNKHEVNLPTWRLGRNVAQGAIPAVAFAQMMARRDRGRFLALLADGHSPSVRLASPNGGPVEYALRPEDIDAFHARFVALPMLVERFGTHRNTFLAQLRAAEIRPFAPEGKDYGHIYLREEVERAFGAEI